MVILFISRVTIWSVFQNPVIYVIVVDIVHRNTRIRPFCDKLSVHFGVF